MNNMSKWHKQGFTLVEIVVSIGILAMVCVSFAVIITGALGIYKRGADLSNQGTEAAAIMENVDNTTDPGTPIQEQEGSVNFGTNPKVTVPGTYKEVTVKDVTFKIFVPEQKASN